MEYFDFPIYHDSMTYKRVQSDYEKFTMRPLITIEYCLELEVEEMEEVLNAAGSIFNLTKLENQAYKFYLQYIQAEILKKA